MLRLLPSMVTENVYFYWLAMTGRFLLAGVEEWRPLSSTVTESIYSPALVTRGSSLQLWKIGTIVTISGNRKCLFSGACNNCMFLLVGAKEWPTPRYH